MNSYRIDCARGLGLALAAFTSMVSAQSSGTNIIQSAQAARDTGSAGAPRITSSAPAPRDAAPETAGLRRVLQLVDGAILRAVARQSGDGDAGAWGAWEVREVAGWRAIPAQAVARVRLERDLLREARSLAQRISPRDLVHRVALGEWMLHEGLCDEALRELDAVLSLDPDEAHARALLRRRPVQLSTLVPLELTCPASDGAGDPAAARASLLRRGAKCGAALREMTVNQLEKREDRDALLLDLSHELSSGVDARRMFATLALRRLFPGSEVKELLRRAVLDPSHDVRGGAALALRDVKEPGVIVPVVRGLSSSSLGVRANAVEALGNMGYPAAVEPLVSRLAELSKPAGSTGGFPRSNISVTRQLAYVQDFDVEIAQGASIAKPVVSVVQEGVVLDTAVAGVGVESYAVALETERVCRALSKLTHEMPGAGGRAWLEWWKKNARTWGQPDSAPTTPDSSATPK